MISLVLLWNLWSYFFPPVGVPQLLMALAILCMPASAVLLLVRQRWMWPLAVGLELSILAVCLWVMVVVTPYLGENSFGSAVAVLALLVVAPNALLSLWAVTTLLSRRGRQAFGRHRQPPPPPWTRWPLAARVLATAALLLIGALVGLWGWRSFCSLGLVEAASNQDLPALRRWVQLGGDSSVRLYGRSALHHAAAWGEAEAVRSLLDAGADPDSRDQEGDTPLIMAASVGNLEVVRLLVERGADTECRGAEGRTALEVAYWSHHHNVARYLKAKRPTPLHLPL